MRTFLHRLCYLVVWLPFWCPAKAAIVPDTAFGNAGIVLPYFPNRASPDAFGTGRVIAVQSDGRILVAGHTTRGADTDMVVVRYLANGALDTSYGTQGIAVIAKAESNDSASRLLLLSDGRLLVAGTTTGSGGQNMLLYRLLVTGAIDGSFGTSGSLEIDFDGQDDAAYGLTLDGSGRIIIVGSATMGVTLDLAAARCTADGVLDLTLGGSGKVTTAVSTSYEEGRDVIVQPDGDIVVAGFAYAQSSDDFLVVRFLDNGALDEEFGAGTGIVRTRITSAEDRCQSVILQPDGKIVAAGWTTAGNRNFAAVRYLNDGSLDTTFGVSGIARTPVGLGDDLAYVLQRQSDGKLLLAGTAANTNEQFAVIRYTSAGVLDTSFGSAGKALFTLPDREGAGQAMAMQTDGKVLLGGTASSGSISDMALLRLSTAGALDTAFNGTGRVITDLGQLPPISTARVVEVQPDGRILIAGGTLESDSFKMMVMRFLSSGQLDNSFGDQGRVYLSFGIENDFAYCMAVQSDGRIIVGGYTTQDGTTHFALARLLSNGVMDSDFGTEGTVTTQLGTLDSEMYALALQADGKILAVGYAWNALAVPNRDFAIVRYLPNGTLDNTFGGLGNGVLIQATTAAASEDYATGVTIQNDGKIIVAGTRYPTVGASSFAIMRLTTAGVLDSSFGTGGRQTTTSSTNNLQAQTLLLQADGKPVLTGQVTVAGDREFFCARYLNNGVLDTSFGTSGRAIISMGSSSDTALDAVLDSSGRVIMVGYSVTSSAQFALLRLTTSGVADNTFDNDGRVTWDLGPSADVAFSLALQSNGRILLAGDRNNDMVLARLTEASANQLPVATDDTSFVLPSRAVTLDVLANDTDGDMDTLSIQSFTQPASGGAVIQLGSALRFTATSTFTGASFQYTVSDGQGGTDQATVTISPVSTFAQWQSAHFAENASDPISAGPTRDPDHDELPNILEYAFGKDPLKPDIPTHPIPSLISGKLVLITTRWAAATDLIMAAEFGSDLIGWDSSGVSMEIISSDGILETRQYVGPSPVPTQYQFGRIKVDLP